MANGEIGESFVFKSNYPGYKEIGNGVRQLWALPEEVQGDILTQAINRFETARSISLGYLGFPNLMAADLVRKRDEYHGSRLSDRDILSCLLMGNFDVLPLTAIMSANLQKDDLDCGIWDGEMGKSGYYFYQVDSGFIGAVNPGSKSHISKMWSEPTIIPRVRELRQQYDHLDYEGMEGEDGCIVMKPGVTYLVGVSPAIKIVDLNVSLETRSKFGRWATAGAINSVTVHSPFNGVVTAEMTTFAHTPLMMDTRWLPFQMIFDYVNPGLEGTARTTFSEDVDIPLDQAAGQFQEYPEKMLPRVATRQKEETNGNKGRN